MARGPMLNVLDDIHRFPYHVRTGVPPPAGMQAEIERQASGATTEAVGVVILDSLLQRVGGLLQSDAGCGRLRCGAPSAEWT